MAKAFGFHYATATSLFGLNLKLKSFFKVSDRPRILEIHTPRKINDKIILAYFKAMADQH